MSPQEMRGRGEKLLVLSDKANPNGGDPPLATLQAGGLVAGTLWNVCAEICERLGEVKKSAKKRDRNMEEMRREILGIPGSAR